MTPAPTTLNRYPVHRCRGALLDWSAAVCLDCFTFPWESTPPPSTQFRALWNEERLHFRFDCVDEDLVLGEGETLKERVLGSDRVEIFLAPNLTLTPYYAFEMSPRSEALVYAARFYREYDWDWTCPELHLDASIQGHRYQVQGSLPLNLLRELDVLKAGASEFYAGVYRAEFSHTTEGRVHSGWMPWVNPQTEKADFHTPTSFGIFELVA